jgi:hypothetical protein
MNIPEKMIELMLHQRELMVHELIHHGLGENTRESAISCTSDSNSR